MYCVLNRQSEVASASMKMGPRAIAKSGIGALAAPALVEETVEVTISETATLMHLSIPSLIVASDTRDVMAVDERNARSYSVFQCVIPVHSKCYDHISGYIFDLDMMRLLVHTKMQTPSIVDQPKRRICH